MQADEVARAEIERARTEIEAARRRARSQAPRRESPPDPTALPILPGNLLESASDPEPRVADQIPLDYLYRPSESLEVWLDIWERNVRFPFSSHRGVLGWVLVRIKKLLAPLVRAPLSDHQQRERIFHIMLLRHLMRQSAEIRRYLHDVRSPYSFLRDQAVPDLIARSDALFSILDRRLDALEAALYGGQAGEPGGALRASRCVEAFRGARRVLSLDPDLPGWPELLAHVEAEPEKVAGDPLDHLRLLEGESLGGVYAPGPFLAADQQRALEGLRLGRARLAPGAPMVVEGPPEWVGLALRAVGFVSLEALGEVEYLAREPLPRLAAGAGASAERLQLVGELNRTLEAVERRLDGRRSFAVLGRK